MTTTNDQPSVVLTVQDQISGKLTDIAQNFRSLGDQVKSIEAMRSPFEGIIDDLSKMSRGLQAVKMDLTADQRGSIQTQIAQQAADLQQIARLNPNVIGTKSYHAAQNELITQGRVFTTENLATAQEVERRMLTHGFAGMNGTLGGELMKVSPLRAYHAQAQALQGNLKELGADADPEVLKQFREELAALREEFRKSAEGIKGFAHTKKQVEQTFSDTDQMAQNLAGGGPADAGGGGGRGGHPWLDRVGNGLRMVRNAIGLGGLAYGLMSYIPNAMSAERQFSMGSADLTMAAGGAVDVHGYRRWGVGALEGLEGAEGARRGGFNPRDLSGFAMGSRAYGIGMSEMVGTMATLRDVLKQNVDVTGEQTKIMAAASEEARRSGYGMRREQFLQMTGGLASQMGAATGGQVDFGDVSGLLGSILRLGGPFRNPGVAMNTAMGAQRMVSGQGADDEKMAFLLRAGLSPEDAMFGDYKAGNVGKILDNLKREGYADNDLDLGLALQKLIGGDAASAKGWRKLAKQYYGGGGMGVLTGMIGDDGKLRSEAAGAMGLAGNQAREADANFQEVSLKLGGMLNKAFIPIQNVVGKALTGEASFGDVMKTVGGVAKDNPLMTAVLGAAVLGPGLIDLSKVVIDKLVPGFGDLAGGVTKLNGALSLLGFGAGAAGTGGAMAGAAGVGGALATAGTVGGILLSAGTGLGIGTGINAGIDHLTGGRWGEFKDNLWFGSPGDDRKKFDVGWQQQEGSRRLSKVFGARITSEYGMRVHPITGQKTFHGGVDIGLGEGTRLGALVGKGGGEFLASGTDQFNGNWVTFRDKDSGAIVKYIHQQKRFTGMKAGQALGYGDFVGNVGHTGMAAGPHLHMAVRDRAGNQMDPRLYMMGLGVANNGRGLVATSPTGGKPTQVTVHVHGDHADPHGVRQAANQGAHAGVRAAGQGTKQPPKTTTAPARANYRPGGH